MDNTELEEAFRALSIFQNVNGEVLKSLQANSKLKHYKKGEHVFRDKEEVCTIYLVVSGMVTLYKISSLGEKKVIFVYGRDNLLNEVMLQELPASVSCEVREHAVLLCIPKAVFLNAMEQDKYLNRAVIESMAIKIRRLYRQLKNTSNSLRGDKKIVAKLWKLGSDHGIAHPEGTLIDMELSITYLADMIGSKRETVSRQVKMLAETGILKMDKNHFIIPDMDKLREYFKKD